MRGAATRGATPAEIQAGGARGSVDVIYEAFNPGYSEEEVVAIVDEVVPSDDPARRGLRPEDKVGVVHQIVHRRTAVSAVRPGKGPIPKVSLPPTTLSDYLPGV